MEASEERKLGYPIGVVEYAKANEVADEPWFEWWVSPVGQGRSKRAIAKRMSEC